MILNEILTILLVIFMAIPAFWLFSLLFTSSSSSSKSKKNDDDDFIMLDDDVDDF